MIGWEWVLLLQLCALDRLTASSLSLGRPSLLLQ